jgi:hypothetical protein
LMTSAAILFSLSLRLVDDRLCGLGDCQRPMRNRGGAGEGMEPKPDRAGSGNAG